MDRPVDLHTPRTGELERDPSLDERLDSAVRIVSHDPAWAGQAREELGTIKDALGLIAVRLEHVGSTAVAGLAAKPILDLQLSVRRVEPRMLYAEALGELGYRFVADPASPDYHLFAKPAQRPRSHHLHVCEAAGEHELRHLAVRDFLRAHSAEATRYGALKRELVRRAPADRLAYIAGKKHYTDELQARALAWATAGSTSSLPADVRKAQDLGGAGSAG